MICYTGRPHFKVVSLHCKLTGTYLVFTIHFLTVQLHIGRSNVSKCPTCVLLYMFYFLCPVVYLGVKRRHWSWFCVGIVSRFTMLLSSSQLLLRFPYHLPSLVLIIASCSQHVLGIAQSELEWWILYRHLAFR